MKLFKRLSIIFPLTGSVLVILFLLFKTPVMAAAPDGLGPWADTVVSSSQGLMKNGGAVPAIRSNPSSALGVAENDTVDGNFYSLGFGGQIVLGFDNGISDGVFIVEATNPDYPLERANVELSDNGTTWINAGAVAQDGTVNLPETINCARFIRITDISDAASMPDDIADGYDVDGAQAVGELCTPSQTSTPSPTPTATPSATPSPTPGPTDQPTTTTTTTTSTTPGFPNAGGNVVPGFPNTGNVIPRLPDTGIGPDDKNTTWIQSAIDFIFSIIHKALSSSSN